MARNLQLEAFDIRKKAEELYEQSPMLRDLYLARPDVRRTLDQADNEATEKANIKERASELKRAEQGGPELLQYTKLKHEGKGTIAAIFYDVNRGAIAEQQRKLEAAEAKAAPVHPLPAPTVLEEITLPEPKSAGSLNVMIDDDVA